MKIFLTGGGGFVGKNLLEQLSSKHVFVAPRHQELDLTNAGAVRDFLNKGNFDLVIHGANFGGNRSQTGLSGVYEANTKMFTNLAENQKFFGRLIFLGSGAEYGKQEPIVRAKESDFGKVIPKDEYGMSKYFASEYIKTHGAMVNLRIFGVFGKYEDYVTRFISNAICRALYSMPITIRQNVKFDYVYVSDLIKIIEHFILNEPKEKFYNMGRGESVEILTLAQMVKKETGNTQEIIVQNPGLGKEYTSDNTLLKNELPNLTFTPIETAVKELVEYYTEHLAEIDKNKLGFDA